ncbi:MAG: hypothetical protein M0P39_05350 [Rhodocyclaceae bacterium]|nr:hypothetical protein [Rhodocyclaceae bacterium]
MSLRMPYAALLLASALVSGGCEPMAITAFGVGASTSVSHTLNGIAYRTFTLPSASVKGAASTALTRMGFKPESGRKEGTSEVLVAKANDREISIELEPLSPTSTRMRSVVKQGLFYDSATAVEIILQTEKVLARS